MKIQSIYNVLSYFLEPLFSYLKKAAKWNLCYVLIDTVYHFIIHKPRAAFCLWLKNKWVVKKICFILDEKLYAIKYIMYHIYTINFIIKPDFRYTLNCEKENPWKLVCIKKGEWKLLLINLHSNHKLMKIFLNTEYNRKKNRKKERKII